MTPEKKSLFSQSPTLFLSSVSQSNCVALVSLDGQRVVMKKEEWISEKKQSQEVLRQMERLLKQENIKPTGLKAIVVHAGPGSFTGTRIGISIAQSLGYAAQKPVFGIDTYSYLAHQLTQEGIGEAFVLVLIPGIKDSYYAGLLEKNENRYRLINVFNGSEQEIRDQNKSINPLLIRKMDNINFDEMITYVVHLHKSNMSEKFDLNTHLVQPFYGASVHVTKKPNRVPQKP